MLSQIHSLSPGIQHEQLPSLSKDNNNTNLSSKNIRKVSDAQTNISSSYNSSNSSFSLTSSLPITFSSLSLTELTLLKLYSTQKHPLKYFDESNPKHMNFYYLSRKKIYDWINDVLSSTSLLQVNKHSIYHRFTYAYSTIMSMFYQKEQFYTKNSFKILVVAVFLLCYKMEGFTISKLSITSMIKSFLKTVKMNQTDINNEIQRMEIEICKLLNYDIFILEDNQYQISLILIELLKKKFHFDNKYYEHAVELLHKVNKFIDSSTHIEVNFGLFPIEKAMIGVFAVLIYLNNETLGEDIFEYVDYFYNNLNVVSCGLQEKDLIILSKHYMKKIKEK